MTMYPETAIRARLLASPVYATIGDRFYPMKAPQNAARPYVVYQRVSSNPERHMRGAAHLARARLQLASYADTYTAVRPLADLIRFALDGFRGDITVGTGTFNVRHLSLDNEFDSFVDPPASGDDGFFTVIQDFLITYPLPAPVFT